MLHQKFFTSSLLLLTGLLPLSNRAGAEDFEFFEKNIRPLFAENCYKCHSAQSEKIKGGLLLDTREGLLKGGRSGPAIIPGDPEKSLLIKAVLYTDKDLQMPPDNKKLSDSQIAALVRWVKMNAPDPRLKEARFGLIETAKAREWWAFRSVVKTKVPGTGAQNPIDAFIGEKLESAGLQKAAPAERRVLLRRATFDLTGLPPTSEEMRTFLQDNSPDAFASVVDRLLESPAYGQCWTRHWLDVVRYADYHDPDPKARTASCEPLEAWRYRDWVVDCFNNDLPFDQFAAQQIAGDLLPGPNGEAMSQAGMIATGFLVNGAWDRGDADKEKMVSDMVDDQIDTVGKAFLGLSLGCARCHDHKFDPVSTEDYYALAGIFYSTHFMETLGAKGGEITLKRIPLVPRNVAAQRDGLALQLDAVKAKLAALDKLSPPVATNHPERLMLLKERDVLQSELPPPYPVAMTVQEGGMPGGLFPNIQDVPIHIRGSYTRLGEKVARRIPAFFAGESQPPITNGSGRRELAAWVASKENPLTARVIVNRIWQWHFGEGLVRTPNNFGMRSEPPTHPAMLDWLAAQFIEDGWSIKALHRRIMLSTTYQQSSAISQSQFARDPNNRWLGRFNPHRLEAEAIRDAMIFVSGRLDLAPGGPADVELGTLRRSLYVQTARWDRSNFSTLFDAANPDASVEKRNISTVAPQALLMLNNNFVREQAKHLAKRLFREGLSEEAARIEWLYHLLFGREASPDEVIICRELLEKAGGLAHETAWQELAHVLLCSNEFVYVD